MTHSAIYIYAKYTLGTITMGKYIMGHSNLDLCAEGLLIQMLVNENTDKEQQTVFK